MEPAVLVTLLAMAALALGVALLWQSRSGGRWGFGTLRAVCPRCGTPLPMIRMPASREEVLWGGWTCQHCGCKVDKHGHERPQP
jgi:hypothetical protein